VLTAGGAHSRRYMMYGRYNPYDSRYDRRGGLVEELIELDEIEAIMDGDVAEVIEDEILLDFL
jgi:hypothetical protein